MSEYNSISFSAPLRLLLVDDDSIALKATGQYLSAVFSHHVDTALSGDTALEMIASHQYDAVIADYEMEGMSGIDLLKKIRSAGIDIPFIMFTGKGREEVVIASIDNGADGYVQKGGEIRSQFAELSHKISTVVQKRRAEKALLQSEAEYRHLFTESPLAYLSLDPSGTIVKSNRKTGELLGLSPDSLIGSHIIDIFADLPEGKDRFMKIFDEFLTRGEHPDTELIIRQADGTERWVSLSMKAVPDDTGIVRIFSVFQDITDKKRTDQDLQQMQKQLREIHRQACIGIWDWDMRQDCIAWSEEVYRITGWDPERAPPSYTNLSRIFTPESWDRLQSAVTGAIEAGTSYDLELEVIRPDSTRIWTRATGSPLYDSTGALTGLHGTIQDITERKKAARNIELQARRQEALLNLHHIADASERLICDYAIDAICTITESRYSFFGFLDADEKTLLIHSWSENALRDCSIADKPIEYPVENAGIWGEAVRTRSVIMINDYSQDHPAKKDFLSVMYHCTGCYVFPSFMGMWLWHCFV